MSFLVAPLVARKHTECVVCLHVESAPAYNYVYLSLDRSVGLLKFM